MSLMRMTERLTILALLLVCGMLILSPGCKGTKSSDESPGPGGKLANLDMVLAKVGDTDIHLGELLSLAHTVDYLQQMVIVPEILTQEAKKRGVYPTQQKFDDFYNNTMKQQGGEQAYLAAIPPMIPKKMALDEFRRQTQSQVLKQALVEDEFIKEHGTPSDQELSDAWSTYRDELTGPLAAQLGIPKEQVTMEAAKSKLMDQIKQRWMMENAQKFIANIITSYPVKNYVLEQYSTANPEEVVVPQMPTSAGGFQSIVPPGGMVPGGGGK